VSRGGRRAQSPGLLVRRQAKIENCQRYAVHGRAHARYARRHPAPSPSCTTDEILAGIAADGPHGATADRVARPSGLGLDGEAIQGALEEVVAHGLLDRRGLGCDVLYTLVATGATKRPV